MSGAARVGMATIVALLAGAAAGGDAPRAETAGRAAGEVDPRAFGAVGDGVADDTAAFERAAATGRTLRVAHPPVHYKLTRRVRLTASVVGDGSLPEIRMHGADGTEERTLFEIRGYRGPGIVVRGLRLDGGWDGVARPGEWSHLVLVKGSRHVTIEDNVLVRPFGDCVLVGGEGHPDPSEDVVIRRNRMERPRRCCVAVISARRLAIVDNVMTKTLDYVSAIDLEPNPGHPERVEDVDIAGNTFDVPNGVAVQAYTHESVTDENRGVRVRGNTARARVFFLKGNNTGSWSGIRVTGNRYLGDPAGDPRAVLSLLVVEQEPRFAPRVLRDVVVEDNVVAPALVASQRYEDRLLGVRELRLVGNRWPADPRYRLLVRASPGAVMERNEPAAAVARASYP